MRFAEICFSFRFSQLAKATSQLVHASVQAQKDRTKEGRAKSGAKYHADPMYASIDFRLDFLFPFILVDM